MQVNTDSLFIKKTRQKPSTISQEAKQDIMYNSQQYRNCCGTLISALGTRYISA